MLSVNGCFRGPKNPLRASLIFLVSLGLMRIASAHIELLPRDFVYLKKIDPTIVQDMRYATDHNFIGRPIRGYHAPQCILTKETALALHRIQQTLLPRGLSLQVYDCYRPQRAVNDFMAWSQQPGRQEMKAEFYPDVNKADVFRLGYVASQSGHSRGSTVDLTLTRLGNAQRKQYKSGQPLVSCFAPYAQRFQDGSLDMGTGFDCFDPLAHNDATRINALAYQHRGFLKKIMTQAGFVPYQNEWWHFTLANEPYPQTYFNFVIYSG